MADKYENFEQLASREIEGKDFAIRCADRESNILIMAPHAGSIEPGTGEIALAIASEDISYYLFEGTKNSGNGDLHITSTKFNEPLALQMAGRSQGVVTIHGEGSEANTVYLGGRNLALKNHICAALEKAGFNTGKHDNPGLHGVSPDNICNRGVSASGVQLELGKGLRRNLFNSLSCNGRQQATAALIFFSGAVREGLQRASAV